MAHTAVGRRLTEAHKQDQILLGSRYAAASRVLLGELDPDRIDATLQDWSGLQTMLAEAFHRDSTNAARQYLTAYRGAEVGEQAASSMPLAEPVFDAAETIRRSQILGPMAKARIAAGATAQEAVDAAFWSLVGDWQVPVMAGGRDAIDKSTLANRASTGWRRVTDGNPCVFCAMLAGRGPAYRSERTARGTLSGRAYHGHCGCTVEEIFGTWTPTAEEERYIDAYEAAAKRGGTASDITRRMREADDGTLFSDAATRKPARPVSVDTWANPESLQRADEARRTAHDAWEKATADAAGRDGWKLYTGHGFADMNALLRQQAHILADAERMELASYYVEELDDFFKSAGFSLNDDTYVKRAIIAAPDWNPADYFKAGSTVMEPGYLSTTTNQTLYGDKPAGSLWNVNILAPKGTRAVYGVADESEIIFDRGTAMKVLKIDPEANQIWVEVLK